jgi:hypothetical protein
MKGERKMKYTLLKNKVTGERSIRINATGERIFESLNPDEYKTLRKKALTNKRRANRDDLMRSCGLTKVIGSVSGQIYWE